MHVNVSGAQLAQPDFPALVQKALLDARIHANQLVIEITESILIEKRSIAIPHLEELRALGVKISLDDFGTGYSSFSMLHRLPVDEIEIDRSFVDQIGVSAQGDAVVATMLELGRTLGKAIVAEGIETEVQLARLVQMGCNHGQGYLLSHPLAPRQAQELVADALTDQNELRAAIVRRPAPRPTRRRSSVVASTATSRGFTKPCGLKPSPALLPRALAGRSHSSERKAAFADRCGQRQLLRGWRHGGSRRIHSATTRARIWDDVPSRLFR